MPSVLAYRNDTVDFQVHYFNYQLGKLNHQINQLTTLTIITSALLAIVLLLSVAILGVCLLIQWKNYKSFTKTPLSNENEKLLDQ